MLLNCQIIILDCDCPIWLKESIKESYALIRAPADFLIEVDFSVNVRKIKADGVGDDCREAQWHERI